MQIRPPEVKNQWEENAPWVEALLLAYESIREHEELEIASLSFIKWTK